MTQVVQWGTPLVASYDLGLASAFMQGAIAGNFTPATAAGTMTADLFTLMNFATPRVIASGYDVQAVQNAAARFGVRVSGYDRETDTIPEVQVAGRDTRYGVPRRRVPEPPGRNFAAAVEEGVSAALITEGKNISGSGAYYVDQLGLFGGFKMLDFAQAGFVNPSAAMAHLDAARVAIGKEMRCAGSSDFYAHFTIGLKRYLRPYVHRGAVQAMLMSTLMLLPEAVLAPFVDGYKLSPLLFDLTLRADVIAFLLPVAFGVLIRLVESERSAAGHREYCRGNQGCPSPHRGMSSRRYR